MSVRTRGVVASSVLLLLALPGCSGGGGDVPVDAPSLGADELATCTKLLDALPPTLVDESSRPVTPADAPAAAWGDPPITLTCGAAVPPEFNEFSSCVVADGVGWFVPEAQQSDESSDITWTAIGYRPVVSVHVPAHYRPAAAAGVIASLAAPVRETLRLEQRCK
ncbi:MAG: hypothetical protein JWN22_777 [Nocardioides sp.]|nr:hypothetical protein [Nocardioides sp.]